MGASRELFVVGDQDDCAALRVKVFQELEDLFARGGIQVAGRLIREEKGRFIRENKG